MDQAVEVTARVVVSHISQGKETTQLYIGPDYQDGKNQEWASATPSLSLTMVVKNEVAEYFPHGARMELRFLRQPEGGYDAALSPESEQV